MITGTKNRSTRRIRIALSALCVAAAMLLTSCPETALREHIVKYTVLQNTDNVIHVSTTGNDLNLGTEDAPKRTINAAIGVFAEDGLTGIVKVAAGTYEVNFYEGTHVVLHEGVSVWGGHDPETWEWEQVSEEEFEPYETIIQDMSSGPQREDANGDPVRPRAVDGGTGLTNATSFGGFTVRGSTSQSSVGIYLKASSPAIRRCTIAGGTGQWSVGVYAQDSSAEVSGCTISGGAPVLPEGSTWTWACGVHGDSAALNIFECEITGSTSEDTIYAVGVALDGGTGFSINECAIDSGPAVTATAGASFAEESSGWMGGSTIIAQPSDYSRAIEIGDGSDVTVQNSTITAGGGSTARAVGIYNIESTSNTHHNSVTVSGASERAYGIQLEGAIDARIGQTDITVTAAPSLAGLYVSESKSEVASSGGGDELDIQAGGDTEAEGGQYVHGVQLQHGNFYLTNSLIHTGYGSSESFGVFLWNGGHGWYADNVIEAGSGPWTVGFRVENTGSDSVSIVRSDIRGATGKGITADGARLDIWGNVIRGGAGGETHRGIALWNCEGSITNNTIYGGTPAAVDSPSAFAIALHSTQIGIRNNILFTGLANEAAIWSDALLDDYVENNLFFDYATGLVAYYCNNTSQEYTMNELDKFQNNIAGDPAFVDIEGADVDVDTMEDNDWHLSEGSPAANAGLNFYDDGTDREGNPRTHPYSIGAYEYDEP